MCGAFLYFIFSRGRTGVVWLEIAKLLGSRILFTRGVIEGTVVRTA